MRQSADPLFAGPLNQVAIHLLEFAGDLFAHSHPGSVLDYVVLGCPVFVLVGVALTLSKDIRFSSSIVEVQNPYV